MQKTLCIAIGMFAFIAISMVASSSPIYGYKLNPGLDSNGDGLFTFQDSAFQGKLDELNTPLVGVDYELDNIASDKPKECWFSNAIGKENMDKYSRLGTMWNSTTCEVETDLTKADPHLMCEEISNIGGAITLKQSTFGNCSDIITAEYANYEQYGYTKAGDSTFFYLRPIS